jgi:hypothetical protein
MERARKRLTRDNITLMTMDIILHQKLPFLGKYLENEVGDPQFFYRFLKGPTNAHIISKNKHMFYGRVLSYGPF